MATEPLNLADREITTVFVPGSSGLFKTDPSPLNKKKLLSTLSAEAGDVIKLSAARGVNIIPYSGRRERDLIRSRPEDPEPRVSDEGQRRIIPDDVFNSLPALIAEGGAVIAYPKGDGTFTQEYANRGPVGGVVWSAYNDNPVPSELVAALEDAGCVRGQDLWVGETFVSIKASNIDRYELARRLDRDAFVGYKLSVAGEALDIVRTEIDKSVAASSVCQSLRIAPQSTLVVGTNESDRGLMEWCNRGGGLSAALSGAAENIKEVAGAVLPLDKVNGVLQAVRAVDKQMERLGLNADAPTHQGVIPPWLE